MIGAEVRRREDARLLTGAGCYVDDVRLEGALHLALVRSPHAHARIRRVTAADALSRPGVVAVLTLDELPEVRDALPLPPVPAVRVRAYRQSALADGVVRFVGEPVVAVLGATPAAAADGAAAVVVEWTPLAAAADPEAALAPGAPLVHPEWGDNLAATVAVESGDVERALARAAAVVTREFRVGRLAATPLEPRAVAARWDVATRTLDIWASTQLPFGVRDTIAHALGVAAPSVRVIAPDVGGAFGAKGPVYPEEVLVAALARRWGRAVRWADTRTASFTGTSHGGDQHHRATLAVGPDGEFAALVDDFVLDAGAYLPRGGIVASNTAAHLPGAYRVAAYRCTGRIIVTHKTPNTPYRGAGRTEAAFVVERLVDLAARALGLDRLEIRRRNVITPAELPYTRGIPYRDGLPIVYDSGDYPALLEEAARRAGYAGFPARQAAARRAGRRLGIGVACYNEGTAVGPHEGATVGVERDGRVRVTVGAPSQGQGHATTLAQVAAQGLGVPLGAVDVIAGDTTCAPASAGTFASRVAVLAGNATAGAAEAVRRRALRVAALALECDPDDLVLADGRVHVKGVAGRSLSLGEVAIHAARPDVVRATGEVGLAATRYHAPATVTWSPGAHAAVVEVDRETGAVAVLAYHAVHDVGHEINPRVVEGQVHGGVAQGIGAALTEELVYDAAAQPLTATLMEYGLPRADGIPAIDAGRCPAPSPLNPLGLKGAGEGAAVPPPAVVANAVADALAEDGLEPNSLPLRPSGIVAALAKERAHVEGAGR